MIYKKMRCRLNEKNNNHEHMYLSAVSEVWSTLFLYKRQLDYVAGLLIYVIGDAITIC